MNDGNFVDAGAGGDPAQSPRRDAQSRPQGQGARGGSRSAGTVPPATAGSRAPALELSARQSATPATVHEAIRDEIRRYTETLQDNGAQTFPTSGPTLFRWLNQQMERYLQTFAPVLVPLAEPIKSTSEPAPPVKSEGGPEPAKELKEVTKALAESAESLTAATASLARLHDTEANLFQMSLRLNEELADIARGAKSQFITSLLRKLIRIRNDLLNRKLNHVDQVADDIEEMLNEVGWFRIEVKPDDPFDPTRHRAISTITTCLSDRDQRIAEVRGTCWQRQQDDRPTIYAEVIVYSYTAPPRLESDTGTPGTQPGAPPTRFGGGDHSPNES